MDSEEKRVVFETDSLMAQQSTRPKFVPGIPRFVMKYSGGYVKDENQANYVLIGFVVAAIVISLFLILSGGTEIPKEALENPEYGLPEVD